MKEQEPITIVVVCDDHYLILLAALIKSIEVNHKSDKKINLYIVEDGVKPNNKNKLIASVNPNLTKVNWISLAEAVPPGIKLPLDRSSYPLNIYMRLFIAYFIPQTIEKVLYLDVDMLVLEDISQVYNHNIADKVIGAVTDHRIKTFDNSWGGILNYKELGLAADTPYFNTGLLLINTKLWREQNITQNIIDCIYNNKKFANYPDQYGLNVVLANQWYKIDLRWNYFSTEDDLEPYLVHFVSRKPIYKSYNSKPKYQTLFFEYLNKTVWKGFKPVGESVRYVKKIENVMVKIGKMIY